MYEVEFPDGQRIPYAANQIAAEIYAQVDTEGICNIMIDAIIDHNINTKHAVTKSKAFFYHKGKKKLRKTIAGVKLLAKCRDGSKMWIPLKDLKKSSPVQVAQYAKANNLLGLPAFKWWTPYVLRKAKIILSKIKARMSQVTHKYGVELPRSADHAAQLDRQNNNTLWAKVLDREMSNVSVHLKYLTMASKHPLGKN